MEKILVFPKWMRSLQLYNKNSDFVVKIGKLDEESKSAHCVVGISLGALAILRDINFVAGKIILINPLLPKRNLPFWFVRWLKFVTTEGLFLERQKFTKNPIEFFVAFFDCMKLLSMDFSGILDEIPKDKILVIRGVRDRFFCDDDAVAFLKSKNVNFVEVDAGHNWSEAIERRINTFL